MQNQNWATIIAACADPRRAQQYVEQFKAASPTLDARRAAPEQIRILVALFSGSQALSELLIKHPEWLEVSLKPDLVAQPRLEPGLRREVTGWLKPLLDRSDFPAAYAKLRLFRQREMMRVAARDLARLGQEAEIVQEISDIADVCLDAVYQLCWRQQTERLGTPYHQDARDRWQPTPCCVLGLGKLGGQELNYSSDVDVMFVYGEEGHLFKEPPRKSEPAGKGLTNHQFFKRLAEMFVAEVGKLAPEGRLYRIDLRLRPEGEAGPLARSESSYESFYAQWGQTWERMMLIKARCVAGDAVLAAEFLELIQPFRYPRSTNERVLAEIGAMKQRIENEVVKAGEIDRNVKLGRGGIREVEFVVQTLQLLNGGRVPFLQTPQTVTALQNLVRYDLLPADDAVALTEAYWFLRAVEHRLQMENDLQTHTIPTERKARERLALLMGFGTLTEFEKNRERHARQVRAVYDKVLKIATPIPETEFPRDMDLEADRWKKIIASHSFRDVEQAFRLIRLLVNGPGFVHVSPRTVDSALQLLPRLFALCPGQDQRPGKTPVLSDPDRVLARLDSFITAYGSRAMLYETWVSNPSLFTLLLWLFDRSEFLAEIAIRTPDLVDELELSGRLRRSKTAAEILADLWHGREDEDQRFWLRRYHQAEFMRIGLRDILGLADFEQNLVELSALADACLQYSLEVVLRKNKWKTVPLAIIGLGKLGGAEINYGSDLDILLVADPTVKNLAGLQRLAVEVMEMLSAPTERGVAFEIDARLRPDGEKGLLVNTLDAHEDYYRKRAMLWELQSISRSRFVVGNEEIGGAFQKLVATLTDFRSPPKEVAAYSPEWKSEIAKMRLRIEKERTPAGKDALAIKTGAGGLMDAEFMAQTLCLAQGWQEPNTLRALQCAGARKLIPDSGVLIENYRNLRRVEGILRRWSYANETVLPDDPAAFYRVAVRCGFASSEEFAKAVAGYRANLRQVYTEFFRPG